MNKYILLGLSLTATSLTAAPFFNNNSSAPSIEQDCILPSTEREKELFKALTKENKRLYNSLDCKGKRRALSLSRQLRDKNQAVQQAAKETGTRQKDEYPNQKDFQKQLQERSGQDAYNKRYGY